MVDYRLYERVNNNEAELQALKEYIKILEKRIFELERFKESVQRIMEDDGK